MHHAQQLYTQSCSVVNASSFEFVMIKNAPLPRKPWSGTQLEIESLIFPSPVHCYNFLPFHKQLLLTQQFVLANERSGKRA